MVAPDPPREEISVVVGAHARPRCRVADEVVLDLLEGVEALVSDELLSRVYPVVEDEVVEVRPVVVALALMDRGAVQQPDVVPGVMPVLAPAHADGEVERLAERPHRVIDVRARETDHGRFEADVDQVLPAALSLRLVGRAARAVVPGGRPHWVSRMPTG